MNKLLNLNIVKIDRGNVLVLMTISLVVLAGAIGLSFDIGNVYDQSRHIRIACDSGAASGAAFFTSALNADMTVSEIRNVRSKAYAYSSDAGASNSRLTATELNYDTDNPETNSGGILVGYWDPTEPRQSAFHASPLAVPQAAIDHGAFRAVRVTAHKTVSTAFARLLGQQNMRPASDSVAVLTAKVEPPSECILPFVFLTSYLSGHKYGDIIVISANDSAGNWGKFYYTDANSDRHPATNGGWPGTTPCIDITKSNTDRTYPGTANVVDTFGNLVGSNVVMATTETFDKNGSSPFTIDHYVKATILNQGNQKKNAACDIADDKPGSNWCVRIQLVDSNGTPDPVNGPPYFTDPIRKLVR